MELIIIGAIVLIALALVIGPLIELPVLSVISDILKRWNTNEE